MHFYDWNIGDYAKKTRHLTNDEDLAYRRLLDIYYDTEQPITHCLATLSRRLRIDEQSIKNVLDEFFPNGINKHADEKIAAYYAYLEKQKLNGSKGGRPKHKPTNNPVVSQNNPVPSQPLTTKPLTTNHEPSKNHSAPKVAPAKKINETEMALQEACKITWKSYSDAYSIRYKTDPVRNATVNTQVKNFVKRIGAEESPHVAAFFVQSNTAFYVQRGHAFGNLLADAEKIRTEWVTGKSISSFKSVQESRLDTARQIMGGKNGNDRPFIDITEAASIESNRTGIPKITYDIREPDDG